MLAFAAVGGVIAGAGVMAFIAKRMENYAKWQLKKDREWEKLSEEEKKENRDRGISVVEYVYKGAIDCTPNPAYDFLPFNVFRNNHDY